MPQLKCSQALEALALKAKEKRVKNVWFFLVLLSNLLFGATEAQGPIVASKAEFVYPDFTACYEKNKNAIVYFGTTRAVAISEKYAIAYAIEKPNVPFVKHDYLGHLYLFESSKPLVPIKLKSTEELKLGEWLASMTENSLHVMTATTKATSNELFEVGAQATMGSIVGGLCCEMYGLGIGDKYFIGSEVLRQFIDGKSASYVDLGARFVENNETIVVDAIDAIPGKSKLKKGDKITAINGKKVKTLQELDELIRLGKKDSKLSAQIERNNLFVEENIFILPPKPVVKKVVPKKVSYLEAKGFMFSKGLSLKDPAYGTLAQKSGLKENDSLIQVDGHKVESLDEAEKYIAKSKEKEISLLFERHDFQFFVTLRR